MSLSARERQALRSIEGGLAESDPDLAAKLAKLSGLMAVGDTPAVERERTGRRHNVSPAGTRRRRPTRTGQVILALWLVISCALIATAATLSHPAAGQCGGLVAVPCSSSSSAPQQPGAR